MVLGPPLTRTDVLLRAHSWLRPSVPHSPVSRHANEYGSYRADCVGYVSMAWGLSVEHGDTDLAVIESVSKPLDKPALRPGDVLMRVLEIAHVAIFEGWADDLGRTFWGLEQRVGLGTVRRRVRYPYENASTYYRPYRYVNVLD
ncbi:hypothetical protein [Actinosynnema sp. NPDC020468]|uniref:hypothetical protein n=1 Tax=Actinosynnema sp. NPDC020468 TaxID=3154488 RepID=UPI0033D06E4D